MDLLKLLILVFDVVDIDKHKYCIYKCSLSGKFEWLCDLPGWSAVGSSSFLLCLQLLEAFKLWLQTETMERNAIYLILLKSSDYF